MNYRISEKLKNNQTTQYSGLNQLYTHKPEGEHEHQLNLKLKLLNLTTYRSTICQQIASLQTWAEQDQTQFELYLMRIFQAGSHMRQMFQKSSSELSSLADKLDSLLQEKNKLQVKSLEINNRLQGVFQQQEKLKRSNQMIDKENKKITWQIKKQKQNKDAIQQSNNNKSQKINQVGLKLHTLKDYVQELRLKQQEKLKQIEKMTQDTTQNIKRLSTKIAQGQKLSQQILEVQKDINNQKNVREAFINKQKESKVAYRILQLKLQNQNSANQKLNAQLNKRLTDMQQSSLVLKREQQQLIQDQQSILKQKQLKNESIQQLQRLKQYEYEVKATNEDIFNILNNCKNEDKIQTTKLQQKLYNTLNNFQNRKFKNSNIKQKQQQDKKIYYAHELIVPMQNNKQAKDNHKLKTRQPYILIEQREEKENKKHRESNTLKQKNCLVMPKHIDQIIKKYRHISDKQTSKNQGIKQY